ncbi:hypothetical protein V8F06_007456 [Rhypophila decipiens]
MLIVPRTPGFFSLQILGDLGGTPLTIFGSTLQERDFRDRPRGGSRMTRLSGEGPGVMMLVFVQRSLHLEIFTDRVHLYHVRTWPEDDNTNMKVVITDTGSVICSGPRQAHSMPVRRAGAAANCLFVLAMEARTMHALLTAGCRLLFGQVIGLHSSRPPLASLTDCLWMLPSYMTICHATPATSSWTIFLYQLLPPHSTSKSPDTWNRVSMIHPFLFSAMLIVPNIQVAPG